MTPEDDDRVDPATALRVADVNYEIIGQRLVDLGQMLIAAGAHTQDKRIGEIWELFDQTLDPAVRMAYDDATQAAIRRTLMSLKSFRRDYSEWERLIVEYALTQSRMTQREVAGLLGVGLSTVNRWAQHPLTVDED